MCLHRWSFCNISRCSSENGKRSWKNYYLQRSSLEHRMKTGRSCTDYTCKSLRGHTGMYQELVIASVVSTWSTSRKEERKCFHAEDIVLMSFEIHLRFILSSFVWIIGRVVGLAYLQENRHDSDNWERPPIVCSASSDGTVRAWNVQQVSTFLHEEWYWITCQKLSSASLGTGRSAVVKSYPKPSVGYRHRSSAWSCLHLGHFGSNQSLGRLHRTGSGCLPHCSLQVQVAAL